VRTEPLYATVRSAARDVSPLDGSTSRSEQEAGRKLRDLPAVLNTFFNGASEVNADKNPRHAVLVGCLGKAVYERSTGDASVHRCPAGSVRLQASNAISSVPKNCFRVSAAAPPSTL
jgi:hypothetical protein